MKTTLRLFHIAKTSVLASIMAVLFLLLSCKETVEIDTNTVDPKDNNSSPRLGLVRPSSADYASIPTATTSLFTATSLPTAFALDIPSIVFYQGDQGSCASCASAMLKSIQDHVKLSTSYINNGIIFSPSYLYSQSVIIPGACDMGSQISKNLEILKSKGVCRITEMPYSDSNCSTWPNATQDKLASTNKIDHFFKLDPIDRITIKQFINAGLPVIVGSKVDAAFRNDYANPLNKNKVWTSFGTFIGNHATILTGWDDSKNAFRLTNSWGSQWGNNGSIWVDYKLVENANVFFEAYIIQNPPVEKKGTILINGSLDFGNIQLSTSATKTIQLNNTGTTSINVSSLSISAPFESLWNGGTLQPGATDIKISFKPTSIGSYIRTLTIESDAINSPNTTQASGVGVQQVIPTKIISLSGNLTFGNVNIGSSQSKTLTITNSGNSTLNISSISLPLGFIGQISGSINPGGSTSISIVFTPTSSQVYNGNVIVNSDATSGSNSLSVSGTGVPVVVPTKVISLSGNLSFGNINIGSSANRTLTISNSGNSPMNVSSISLPQGFSGNFSGTIPAGSSTNVSMTFSPNSAQSYSGNVVVNSDATAGNNSVSISGTGVPVMVPTKVISLSGNLSFGNINIGSSANRTLTISNSGNSPMNVSSISLPQGFSGNFSGTIPAGSSTNVSMTFSPNSAQSYSGNVVVNSDATSGNNSVSISGTGTERSMPSGIPEIKPGLDVYTGCNETVATKTYIPAVCETNRFKIKCTQIDRNSHTATFIIKTCDESNWNGGKAYVQIFNNSRNDGYDANSAWLEDGMNSVTIKLNNLIFDTSGTKTLVGTIHINGMSHYCTGEITINW